MNKGFAGLMRISRRAHAVGASSPPSSPPRDRSLPPRDRSLPLHNRSPPPHAARQREPTPEFPVPSSSSTRRDREDEEQASNEDEERRPSKKPRAQYQKKVIMTYEALMLGTRQPARIQDGTEYLYQAARIFPRILGPYVDYDSVLREGIARDGSWSSDLDRPSSKWGPYWEAKAGMPELKERFPGLSFHIPYLRHRPELVASMAKWMKSVAQKSRSDDANRLKDRIVDLLDLPQDVRDKTDRGFRHTSTGRLLCPISLVDQFDEDPDNFCRMVHDMRKGRPRVSAGDYPLFMYNMDEYVPGKAKPGLFKSSIMVACARLIFQGPTAAKSGGATSKKKGKPALAAKMNMSNFSVFTLLYVAALARFTLNAQGQWDDDDGDFKGMEFYACIMTAMAQDGEWCAGISAWYCKQLYGASSGNECADQGPSSHELLMAEFEAEQAEKDAAASGVMTLAVATT
ncbi:hypothetical protein C2E23DRAFT_866887 [Lenzites betulinus]|nr:hypothetical protein C2E23DRAFT_866887 [Lenzites betulinus]